MFTEITSPLEIKKWDIAFSLEDYVQKADVKLDPEISRLRSYPEIEMRDHPARFIHPDGKFGLTLSFRESQRGAAHLGFDFASGKRRAELKEGYPLVPWKDIDSSTPVILQLQTSGDPSARAFFHESKWERTLVLHLVEWSNRNCFKRILLIPAEMNPYPDVRTTDYGKQRYNGTAKKCRFKKMANGLYVRELN